MFFLICLADWFVHVCAWVNIGYRVEGTTPVARKRRAVYARRVRFRYGSSKALTSLQLEYMWPRLNSAKAGATGTAVLDSRMPNAVPKMSARLPTLSPCHQGAQSMR